MLRIIVYVSGKSVGFGAIVAAYLFVSQNQSSECRQNGFNCFNIGCSPHGKNKPIAVFPSGKTRSQKSYLADKKRSYQNFCYGYDYRSHRFYVFLFCRPDSRVDC